MFKLKIPNVKKSEGFSLIELVVVLTIFLTVTGITVDMFISIVQNQRRILQEQELLNQASYATEYMSTALKTAQKDVDGDCVGVGNVYALTHCPNGTLEPCRGVKFINQLDGNVCDEFFFDESVDLLDPPLSEFKRGEVSRLLSNKFKTKYGGFIINGDKARHSASQSDGVQPKVTILLDIEIPSEPIPQEKIIQTTVSQRNSVLGTPLPFSSSCLVGHWKFDENPTQPGPTIIDSSGNNLTATPHGVSGLPESSSDVAFGFPAGSRSLKFGEAGQSVSFGSSPLLNPSSAISVAFWIKMPTCSRFFFGDDSWRVATTTPNCQPPASTSVYPAWTTSDGRNIHILFSLASLSFGPWHQVTVVWQYGQDQKKMYIDGVQVAVDTHLISLNQNSSELRFQDNEFPGAMIDDLRIYRCALTESEVQDLQTPTAEEEQGEE